MEIAIRKKARVSQTRLERRILRRREALLLKKNLCNGCGLCIAICPKEALHIKPAVTNKGRLLHPPTINIDEDECILCGICAVLCPLNAFEVWINDKPVAMFVENNAIPKLIKSIEIETSLCRPDCGITCEPSCPRDAIKVVAEKEKGQVIHIDEVNVDEELCVYCKACEYACPYQAISIEKPFSGSVTIETEKCPQDCQICIEICPSKALLNIEGRLEVTKDCIFCKACETVCPEDAIRVNIERIAHTPVQSAIWISTLEHCASPKAAAKELAVKSRLKQKAIIKNRSLQVQSLLRLLDQKERRSH